VSRSVKDFVSFFEFLNEYEAEFVSLKENCGTTSHGPIPHHDVRALAQLKGSAQEMRSRAERGLLTVGAPVTPIQPAGVSQQ
jgi:hypothetical protein